GKQALFYFECGLHQRMDAEASRIRLRPHELYFPNARRKGNRRARIDRLTRKGVEYTEATFEDRQWPRKASGSQLRVTDSALRRPAGVQLLDVGSIGEVFHKAAGHASCNAQRIDRLFAIKP